MTTLPLNLSVIRALGLQLDERLAGMADTLAAHLPTDPADRDTVRAQLQMFDRVAQELAALTSIANLGPEADLAAILHASPLDTVQRLARALADDGTASTAPAVSHAAPGDTELF